MFLRTVHKLRRLATGWWRLNVRGVCPHCESDAMRLCPMCRNLPQDENHPICSPTCAECRRASLWRNHDEVWTRFKKQVFGKA